MLYVILVFVGIIAGAVCTFALLNPKLLRAAEREREEESRSKQLEKQSKEIELKMPEIRELTSKLEARKHEIAEFDARKIKYKELRQENQILKRDLQNVDVNLRKLEMDRELQRQRQEVLDERSGELGSRYLKENVKWISGALNGNNFANCKQRLVDVIARCREIGFAVPEPEESALLANLKSEYEMAVRAAFEREEQARIKAQIREEQRLLKEIDREVKQMERERTAIQTALDKALTEAHGQHTAEVETLRARLAEAEARAERAKSQAQLTKAGHVYVISNIGSFGEGVYKIGMTRRLEPSDRVRELGDASVPFPFDLHMMISSNDAPALENALHRALHKQRINKANPRKEYFRADIAAICKIVNENHGEVQYIADAEALEYRQSVSMSDEDLEFIASVYDKVEDDGKEALDAEG
jgi:hypothetical protein